MKISNKNLCLLYVDEVQRAACPGFFGGVVTYPVGYTGRVQVKLNVLLPSVLDRAFKGELYNGYLQAK